MRVPKGSCSHGSVRNAKAVGLSRLVRLDFFLRGVMGFKELIYPVHFTLRRVASACNKNAPFWKRGGGAGEAECCHM